MDKLRIIKFMRRVLVVCDFEVSTFIFLCYFLSLLCYVVIMTVSCTLPSFSVTCNFILVNMRRILIKFSKTLVVEHLDSVTTRFRLYYY